jgi:hypothetical protein
LVFRRINEHQAKLLCSNDIYKGLILKDDIFEKISDTFDFNFIYDEVKDLYCADNGRPNEDPIRLIKASLVQRLKGLSDPEMENVARYDIRIKHFLRIPIEDYGFDYSTLSRFRTRLGAECFERIFQKIIKQIMKLGIIKNSDQQFIDSMPVLAHAALPSVTCLIYQGIKAIINSVDLNLKTELFKLINLDEKKLSYNTKPRPIFKMEKAERKKAFEKSVDCAREIIFILQSKKYFSDELEQLKQILNENVNEDNEKINTNKPIKTLVDPEAKLGHKTKKDLIFGYKNNSLVTGEGIITAVDVSTAAERDDKQFTSLIEKSEKVGLKPEVVDGDSAYGFIETFKNAETLKITLNAPFRGLSENELSTYELEYDSQTNSVTCLNGINIKLKGKNKLLAEFPIRICRSCPKKEICPISNSKIIKFHKDHDVARRSIKRQRKNKKDKEEAEKNGIKIKSRLIIENVYGYLQKLKGKKTPYYGLQKAKIHVYLVATISNMMKTIRLSG